MYIETKTIVVKEGYADQIVQGFSQPGPVEKFPGFVDLSVYTDRARKGEEKVLVVLRWESIEAWKAWEVSEVHLEGHRRAREEGRPDYIISSSHGNYELKAVKLPG